VAGEGEGSKATLVAWLKRRAEADFAAAIVGRTVWVCWCADAEYYLGEIISYSRENGKHKVRFELNFEVPVESLACLLHVCAHQRQLPNGTVDASGCPRWWLVNEPCSFELTHSYLLVPGCRPCFISSQLCSGLTCPRLLQAACMCCCVWRPQVTTFRPERKLMPNTPKTAGQVLGPLCGGAAPAGGEAGLWRRQAHHHVRPRRLWLLRAGGSCKVLQLETLGAV